MASNQGDREAAKAKTDRQAEELGRRAARLLRRGKPRVEKALNQARPRVEEAVNKARPQVERSAKDAWRYAQDHEDEIKRTALRGARMRVRGPFGFLIDALQSNGGASQPQPACPSCGTPYAPSARFCTECGANLAGDQT
jgi:hypothetical protein